MFWIITEKKEEFRGLSENLIFNGFNCVMFKKISDAITQLNSQIPDGILLDSDHSEIFCFEFCHKIKSSPALKKIKLFIVSSNILESMEEASFDAGADEFIIKPIRQKALVKRISARLNISLPDISILYKLKGKSALQIDKESYSVYLNQVIVPLSRKEFELLHLMASHPGKVFTREEIFKKVWNKNHISKKRTIDVHILRLRKKLGEEFFSTQKGVGYRFCA